MTHVHIFCFSGSLETIRGATHVQAHDILPSFFLLLIITFLGKQILSEQTVSLLFSLDANCVFFQHDWVGIAIYDGIRQVLIDRSMIKLYAVINSGGKNFNGGLRKATIYYQLFTSQLLIIEKKQKKGT